MMNVVNTAYLTHYVKETTKKGLHLGSAMINEKEKQ